MCIYIYTRVDQIYTNLCQLQPANEHDWVMTLCGGVVGSGDPPHFAVRLSFSSLVEFKTSEREVPITTAQRIVIKFLTNENVGPNAIWRRLRAHYGESTLSKTQVKFWHKEFRGGRDAVQNTNQQRRPRTSTTPENIYYCNYNPSFTNRHSTGYLQRCGSE